MTAVLHQLWHPAAWAALEPRCQPGDVVLLAGTATELAAEQVDWPASVSRYVLRDDLQLAPAQLDPSARLIDDEQWIDLIDAYRLNLSWA